MSLESLDSLIQFFAATELEQLHYILLESETMKYLKEAKGNFEAIMSINDEMKKELARWCPNIQSEIRLISNVKDWCIIDGLRSHIYTLYDHENIEIGGKWKSRKNNSHKLFRDACNIFWFEIFWESDTKQILEHLNGKMVHIHHL